DLVEERERVERTGRRLWVELERVEPVALEALDRSVVQRDVAHHALVRRLDCEAVVLHGHEDTLRVAEPNGMVGAPVAERKLEGAHAEGEAEQLVPETHAEERRSAEKVANGLDGS